MTAEAEKLRRRLGDESPEVRRRAVIDLAAIDPAEAGEPLVRALGDRDWRVRKEAAAVAARIADPGIAARLIDAMIQEDEVGLRNAAAEALARSGEEAITALVARIPEMNAAGRKIAFEVLGSTDDPRALALLIAGLGDPDYNVRACAAEWLGEIGGERAAEALLGCLGSPDKLLVLASLQSLNRQAVPVPWPRLAPLAGDRLYGADLLMALGRSGEPKAAPIIASRLSGDEAAARALALLHGASPEAAAAVEEALRTTAGDEAIDRLCRTARDGEPAEQRASAACLLWSRRPAVLPAVVQMAESESLYPLLVGELALWGAPAVAGIEALLPTLEGRPLASAIGLLARLIDPSGGDARSDRFIAYLECQEPAAITAAASAVARFKDPRAIPRLIGLTGALDERVRRAAGQALADIGRLHPEAVRARILEVEIREPAGVPICRVFEAVGRPEDAARLSAALGSPSPSLRAAVIAALAASAGEGAIEAIARAMTDEDLAVRMAAASALGRIGPAAAETIASALHSADGPLKAALIRALGRTGHAEAPTILGAMCRESAEIALAALEAMTALRLDGTAVRDAILSHGDSEVVKQALALLGPSVSTADLLRLLDHPAWDVRLAAAGGLAAMGGDPPVGDALVRRLGEEKDDLVLEALRRAIRELGKGR